MRFDSEAEEELTSVTQLAAALSALGLFRGANTRLHTPTRPGGWVARTCTGRG